MLRIIPGETPHPKMHQYLLGSIAPRPIAFASTVDARGNPNLSPFSFFNVFGYNPTTLIFSPSRRGRDNSTKNTLENAKSVPEVVINVVTYDMVNQASLASTEYPPGVDEFIKAGFSKLPSELVRPFRVKESPVQMECRVRDIIETGSGGGAANLIICEILIMHVNEDILGDDGMIDQQKIRLVGRLGKDYYVRAFGDALFEVEKPLQRMGIGIDALPEKIRNSRVLTGNDLGQLGNVENLPNAEEIRAIQENPEIKELIETSLDISTELNRLALNYLQTGHAYEALKLLMLINL
ncbi:MAG: flavin reductase family protein [Bacteroidales bacterium]|nr:flavin reductase family protein [Bacteroidales bacterium]